MTDVPYPEPGITEETRRMYPDNYTEKIGIVFNSLVDEIIAPPKPNHKILCDELALIRDHFAEQTGERDQFNAMVVTQAIRIIEAV